MKKVIIVFVLLAVSLFQVNGQSCLPSGITINTQEEIDDFAANYPNCSEIEGSLIIEDDGSGTITSLSGLSQITTVGGELILRDLDVVNLAGLDNLESVGEFFTIDNNSELTDLSATNNLISVGGLYLRANSDLEALSGFTQLTTCDGASSFPANVEASLHIYLNTSLESLTGFDAVESIGSVAIESNGDLESIDFLNNVTSFGSLVIDNHLDLLSINGFSQLNSLESLHIRGNFFLNEISGFSALESVSEYFSIDGNINLINLHSFESLTSVGTSFWIRDNSALESLFTTNTLEGHIDEIYMVNNYALSDLEGLAGVTSCNDLTINQHESLQDISALQNITTIDVAKIYRNPLLSSLPFSSLESITGRLELERLPLVTNFQGMSSLDSLGGLNVFITGITDFTGLENITSLTFLDINNNHALSSFNGLNNVTSIEYRFWLFYNTMLSSLTGLENLTSIGTDFDVFYNINLTNFEGCNNLTTIGESFHILEDSALVNLTGLGNLTSIGEDFFIERTTTLQSLNGIENLETVGGTIDFKINKLLYDLNGLVNADLATSTDSIAFTDNPALSVCGQESICNYIMTGGAASFSNNASGCNSMNEIVSSCFEDVDNTSFVGNVFGDMDQNCLESAGDVNWSSGILVHIENDEYSYGVTTDENGYYWLPALEGEYALNALMPTGFWTPCFTDSLVIATATNDTIITDLFASPLGDCPYLEWDMILQPLRICGDRTVVIEYCNYGVQPAEDVVYSVMLDTFMTITYSSIGYTVGANGELLFDIETVDVLECGQFEMSIFLDCDSVEINDLQCFDVELMSDELCAPNDTTWDGSIVEVSGYCDNDSIYFKLENIGTGNMAEPAQFRVDILIEDIVLLIEEDDYELLAGEIETRAYKMEGDGLRIEADQTIGHPIENEATVVVPACDDVVNNLILTMFPSNNGDPFSETFCTYAVNSFDPNIKTTIPTGVGENHEIDKDWELDYTIQFQNTGNDVAYVVRINDVLSDKLDINTLRVKGASHDFTWALNPNRELVFTFDDIFLPDSTTNEPASHGFIQYSIKPNADLLPGDRIENLAAIYFDFNDPIITNTVFHTIRKPVVSEIDQLTFCYGDTYQGITLTADTALLQIIEFLEYDSAHLSQLIVTPLYEDTVALDLALGSDFQGVLIEGDTSITLNLFSQGGCDSLVVYNISTPLDIDEPGATLEGVTVFPNPVNKLLFVSDYLVEESQDWTLTNTFGQVVWAETVKESERLSFVSVSEFPSGIYLLKVKTESGERYWKVMIE